jgi:hypothetical protein
MCETMQSSHRLRPVMALVRALLPPTASGDGAGARLCVVTVESGGNFAVSKVSYIRFLSCHLFGPVNHGQTWKGWERSGDKGLIIR